MKYITLPSLKEYEQKLRSGEKRLITSDQRIGNRNDVITSFGCAFRITGVHEMEISAIAHTFYEAEGYPSKEEFIRAWVRRHSYQIYMPDQTVYAHAIKRIDYDSRDLCPRINGPAKHR